MAMYNVKIPFYMINSNFAYNKQAIQGYLNKLIKVDEYYNVNFGLFYFITFKLKSFTSTEKKLSISFEITFDVDYSYKKNGKEETTKLSANEWKVEYTEQEREFKFNNQDSDSFWEISEKSKETLEQIEKSIVVIMGAVYKYMIDNPLAKKESWLKTYGRHIKKELLSSEFLLMVHNTTIHQQTIQNSFRGFDSEDKKFNNTVRGLELGLAEMTLPQGNLTITNVELDDSFRISFK